MAKKSDTKDRLQVAALPFRFIDDRLSVLLVTSRETKKWVIPKGWPMRGRGLAEAAQIEAREEAGVDGAIARSPIGLYHYWKRRTDHFELCRVKVFPLFVTMELDDWKERGQRQISWFDPKTAAEMALEPELSSLLLKAATDEEMLRSLRKQGRKSKPTVSVTEHHAPAR